MSLHRISFLTLSLFLCVSCTAQYYDYSAKYPHLHDQMPTYAAEPFKKPQVVLVLGGGGARGMAHLGVLQELEEADIPVDMIVGCSAGSVVGALYAKNPSAASIKGNLETLSTSHVLDWTFFTHCHSLFYGSKLSLFLRNSMGTSTFEELKIPLVVVATDLVSGELIAFNSGLLVPAVHASSAIPLVFSPVKFNNHVFVDGGVLSPLPVDVASFYSADIIIAVDLGGSLARTMPSNMFGVIKRCVDIQHFANTSRVFSSANFLIRPDLSEYGIFDDSSKEKLFELGRQSAREQIPAILQAMGRI